MRVQVRGDESNAPLAAEFATTKLARLVDVHTFLTPVGALIVKRSFSFSSSVKPPKLMTRPFLGFALPALAFLELS